MKPFHFQHPSVRDSVKVTTDRHDHHAVDVTEHFCDRVDVRVRGPRSALLVPVLTPDGGVFDPQRGKLLPPVKGGAWAGSGLFGNNMVATLTLSATAGSGNDTLTSTTRASNGYPVFNLVTTHLRCAMFTNSVSPNFDDTLANSAYGAGVWASNEVSGTGYSAGGAGDSSSSGTFSSPTFANSSGTLTFDASNAVWTSSTIGNAYGALIYDNSGPGPSSAKSAICGIYFGGGYSTSAGTFTIQWSVSGIWTWSGLG